MGGDRLNAMLSGVAPATRQWYLPAWNQWEYLVSMGNRPFWLADTKPNWGEDLIDFIMCESRMVRTPSIPLGRDLRYKVLA